MGWAYCGTDDEGRPIGYGVDATCDHPGCKAEIDRGLSYVCGGMHGGGTHGCGRYFCGQHLSFFYVNQEETEHASLCEECIQTFEKPLEIPPC